MKESVVFFGSGPVAAQSLELLSGWATIEAVVTKPQPTHHKEPFPVLVSASKLGLPVFTPGGKQALSNLISEHHFTSRIGLVIDYGFIINEDVIDAFPLGIVNSHFSLLPEWRGADPISFAILSGQNQTGVSLMLINAAMDEGPLLAQAPYVIEEGATTPRLTGDLVDLSNETLAHVLPLYATGSVSPAPQEDVTLAKSNKPSYSRKLTKIDGILNFTKPAAQLEREIRAFCEWPKSRTKIGSIDVIVTQSHVNYGVTAKDPGQIEVMADTNTIVIHTTEGCLNIDKLKPAGKNEMTAADFIRGYSAHLVNI